jgi:hypothetical protein
VRAVLLCESPWKKTPGNKLIAIISKKIYFDGFLPPAKLNTRLKRARKHNSELSHYRNAHSIPCRTPSSSAGAANVSIFASQSPRSSLTTLPASSFIVPAVLEALFTSKNYMTATEVVPGEADLYCARYLKQHGGLVFTGDSDLLVHDLGSNGAVTFFKDIEETVDFKGVVALQSHIYHPAAITQRIGLSAYQGLLALAFEMAMDNHGTKQSLVARASNSAAIKANPEMYQDFCKEYVLPRPETEKLGHEDPKYAVLQSLDPRISEFILQSPSIAKLAGLDSEARKPLMFLPFLNDSPIRTSAWELSTSVRQLAYGLLNLILPEQERRTSVYENRRQQGDSSGREWQLPNTNQLPEACITVVKRLDQLVEKLGSASREGFWLAAAICQDIEWASSLDRSALSFFVMEQLAVLGDTRREKQECSWDVIHFLAQIQGSYYSFRMLKQITNLLVVDMSSELPGPILDLHNRLQDLPNLDELPDLHRVSSLHRIIADNNILKIAYELLGIEEPQPTRVEDASKPSKKKRKRAQDAYQPSPQKKKSTNPFDVLSQE